MKTNILVQAIDVMAKHEQCSEEYDIACFAMRHALSKCHIEALQQLVNGPVEDGDVISKSLRDDLLELGLAMKTCVKGEQGYNAATYRGYGVLTAEHIGYKR